MNLDNLSHEFDQWQAKRKSPYEEKFSEFLDEKLEDEFLEEIIVDLIFHCIETRRQLKDYIEGNNPGMYD